MTFDELLNHHIGVVQVETRRACMHWHVRREDRKDLQQEIWLTLLRNDGRVLSHFEGRSAVATYLHVVIDRTAARWVRRRDGYIRRQIAIGDTYGLFEEMKSRRVSTDWMESLRREDLALKIVRAVRQVPAAYRMLLYRRYRLGLGIDEIAGLMRISEKAVKCRLTRALERLRHEAGVKTRQGRPPPG